MFNLKNKRIAVYGMGVSGLSALRFIKSLEGEALAINGGLVESWAKINEKGEGVLKYVSKENCFNENDPQLKSELEKVDIVILSPGIPRDHEVLKPVNDKKIPIWGEIELAFRYLEATQNLSPMIGITGTNGKTTTTTFLGEMIEADNKSVFVGGNIGIPFCDYSYDIWQGKGKKDFILLELSSFQLESIDHFHLNVAMILNLFQNHGERYHTIEEYGRSKFFITNRFTKDDLLIYPEDFPLIKSWGEKQQCKKITLDTRKPIVSYATQDFKLPGIHNLVNLSFIVKTAEAIGLSNEAIQKSINTFKGVHHRIEYVSDVKGLSKFRVYNDAKSTNWDATLTAIKAMEDFKKPIHLIIGGKKRGHGDSILPYLKEIKSQVFKLYLIGEMALEIAEELKQVDDRLKVNFEVTNNLHETIKEVREKFGGEEGILLFSPAFPSFDQFNNYAHRGEVFVGLVQN